MPRVVVLLARKYSPPDILQMFGECVLFFILLVLRLQKAL